MPAVTVADPTALPRITPHDEATARERPVVHVVDAPRTLEGEGFEVRRAFAALDLAAVDPFILFDHMGAVEYAPGEAKGAPDHPHRGFETATYMMDGDLEHRDSNGGGGIITDGATQWMTAGAGIVHSEMPTEQVLMSGGLFHGVQLWVNLPKAEKWSPPQYQDLAPDSTVLLTTAAGDGIVRLIAGDLAGHTGPGRTRTPITYCHVSLYPGGRLQLPWQPEFNALTYALAGNGSVGIERRPLREGQVALFGEGDQITISADDSMDGPSAALELMVLGGRPIRETIAWGGPFVMNSRDEVHQAMKDYHAGRMGSIPAKQKPAS